MSVAALMMMILFFVAFAAMGRRRRYWHDPRALGTGRDRALPYEQEPGPSQEYVDTLETRIARLEERLDFTERLLQGRTGDEAPGPSSPRPHPSSPREEGTE